MSVSNNTAVILYVLPSVLTLTWMLSSDTTSERTSALLHFLFRNHLISSTQSLAGSQFRICILRI